MKETLLSNKPVPDLPSPGIKTIAINAATNQLLVTTEAGNTYTLGIPALGSTAWRPVVQPIQDIERRCDTYYSPSLRRYFVVTWGLDNKRCNPLTLLELEPSGGALLPLGTPNLGDLLVYLNSVGAYFVGNLREYLRRGAIEFEKVLPPPVTMEAALARTAS